MGFFEPHGRHRRRDGQAEVDRTVVFNGLEDARAALAEAVAAGDTVTLVTQPGASAWMGAGYFAALVRALGAHQALHRVVYDCGDRTGDVLAALRQGISHVRADATILSPALQDLAAQYSACVTAGPETDLKY